MKRTLTLLTAAVLLGMALPSMAIVSPEAAAAPEGMKRVLIRADGPVLDEIKADSRFTLRYDWPSIGWIAGSMGDAMRLQYAARADVTIEEDIVRKIQCHGGPPPHQGCGGGGGGGPRVSDQTPYGIEQIYNDPAITATNGGAGKRLGHFDTGIDTDHLDLVNRIVACQSTAGGGCDDKNGHGTHTAGTAAADAGSDDLGIWGVASEASIHTIKVCGNGGFCTVSDTIEAIEICITAGCDVITFSISGPSGSEPERAAIIDFVNAGGIFVAASGNDGGAVCSIDYPAAFKEVVSVGAIDSNKNVASFSSRGCTADSNSFDEDGELDFVAAGVSVVSTYKNGGYASASGTSMATPHVAGLALKKGSINGLLTGVEDLGANGVDVHYGNGLPHV